MRALNIHEPFYDKCGEIYLVTSVADGIAAKPVSVEIETFDNIRKGDLLGIGDPRLVVYPNPSG
jgi:hypothetical protein